MSLPPGLILRAGTPGDAGFIQQLHEESIRGLGPRCYSRAEVESYKEREKSPKGGNSGSSSSSSNSSSTTLGDLINWKRSEFERD